MDKKNQIFILVAFFILGIVLAIILRGIQTSHSQKTKTKSKSAEPVTQFKAHKSYPKIALVIDDFGYNERHIDRFLRLREKLTISVLPSLRFSKLICKKSLLNNKEVILHLPLEPENPEGKIRPQADTIYTDMEEKEILARLNAAIESVPGLVGISNHQGSKATADYRLMEVIFKKLYEKNLFFMDSLVTNKSVCEELARELGVRFIKRDVFLDNIQDAEYIKKQITQLVRIAKEYGQAVGVAHDRDITIEVLEEILPQLKKDGIEFVFLSELVAVPD